jgi:starch synthase (maltosyl-transferring)
VKPPIIYNLFPRLVGSISRWPDHARRAADMGFNWIFVNPWHYPGFSGSLYAPREFDRLNPLFLPTGVADVSLEPLHDFNRTARELGLSVMMDLVLNHTSKDSPLARAHPSWFKWGPDGELVSPFAVDPDDPRKVTVWGDLAEVDNEGSADRSGLWSFWGDMVEQALELGFSGFRCDAAYMVPSALWRFLIERARSHRADVLFFAETLGATEPRVLDLADSGLDFFFNSSKWWNFRDTWALDQHRLYGRIAPSISFPESHDTPRLAQVTGADEAVQKQRYAFAAAFSAGVMMPIGYEFGFRRQLNVVTTMPADWERRTFDLRSFIWRVNSLKTKHPSLRGEGRLRPLRPLDDDVLVLERRVDGEEGAAYVIVNKDSSRAASVELRSVSIPLERLAVHRVFDEGGPERPETTLRLDRAEVVYLLPEFGAADRGEERVVH